MKSSHDRDQEQPRADVGQDGSLRTMTGDSPCAAKDPNDSARRQVQGLIARRRAEWDEGVTRALRQIMRLSDALGDALGTVSWDEALNGLKVEALRELEQALRR